MAKKEKKGKNVDPKAKPKGKIIQQTKFPNMTDKREAKLERLGLLYLQAKSERKTADDAVKNSEFACLAEMKRIKRSSYTVGDTTLNVKTKDSISVATSKGEDKPIPRDPEKVKAAEKTRYGGEKDKAAPKDEAKDDDDPKVIAEGPKEGSEPLVVAEA